MIWAVVIFFLVAALLLVYTLFGRKLVKTKNGVMPLPQDSQVLNSFMNDSSKGPVGATEENLKGGDAGRIRRVFKRDADEQAKFQQKSNESNL